MTASELIAAVERAGGRFDVDIPNSRIVFELGHAPKSVLPALEREKERVAKILVARDWLAEWEPSPGERVQ